MFNPASHTISQRGKPYLPVQWRLVWFREQCPQGTIKTEMLHLDTEKGFCIFRATIEDGKGGSATGTKQESIKDFRDFVEKAETGSIGRALAALGYGTQFIGDEFDEGLRLADAPLTTPQSTTAPVAFEPVEVPMMPQNDVERPVTVPVAVTSTLRTPEQRNAIVALCKRRGDQFPRDLETMSRQEAQDWIATLQKPPMGFHSNNAYGNLNTSRAFSLMR